MRRALIVAAVLALGGCGQKASEKALTELEIVENTQSIDRDAVCAAKQKVADAYLSEQDKDSYQLYKGAADSCALLLNLERQNGVAAPALR